MVILDLDMGRTYVKMEAMKVNFFYLMEQQNVCIAKCN